MSTEMLDKIWVPLTVPFVEWAERLTQMGLEIPVQGKVHELAGPITLSKLVQTTVDDVTAASEMLSGDDQASYVEFLERFDEWCIKHPTLVAGGDVDLMNRLGDLHIHLIQAGAICRNLQEIVEGVRELSGLESAFNRAVFDSEGASAFEFSAVAKADTEVDVPDKVSENEVAVMAESMVSRDIDGVITVEIADENEISSEEFVGILDPAVDDYRKVQVLEDEFGMGGLELVDASDEIETNEGDLNEAPVVDHPTEDTVGKDVEAPKPAPMPIPVAPANPASPLRQPGSYDAVDAGDLFGSPTVSAEEHGMFGMHDDRVKREIARLRAEGRLLSYEDRQAAAEEFNISMGMLTELENALIVDRGMETKPDIV